ncbi:MAG: sodium-coupled transporter [Acidobacteria bacterium]|nr:MAG: sodium-coupled transporter [Acidobacteriota bacterium]REJ99189.1 MAG: sodium-coupled transporter [Acidobacteriota bacterium]REK16090.1 MAG: sodium-coupled transporter [Acidobacteriota bacterium]REK43771.1 MAG: sodium-coupled transporter [Acidobacteriota bacterium]
MTFEILFVLAVAVCAVILFATEKLSVDVVAIVIMATLIASGIISAEEGISGFSNKATVTVAAMFILSAGLFKTGAVNYLGDITTKLFRNNFWVGLISVMFAVAFFSAFINNTPVVAIFIPILLGVAKDIKASTSKLLMPMSFASMFGGVCTLIGTSTNILVNSIAEGQGQPAFSMFEIAPLGLAMFLVGTTYMLLIGIRLIPDRRSEGDLLESFDLHEYITEVVLLDDSTSVGKQIKDAPLVKEIDINIIEIQRGEETIPLPAATELLRAGDILRVRCDLEKLKKIREREGIVFKPQYQWKDEDILTEGTKLVEGVIAPHSEFIGKTLQDLNFREEFGATVMALRHRGVLLRDKLSETKLDAGDALLLEVRKRRYNQIRQSPAFVIISEVEQETFRKSKIIPALAIITGVILTASLGFMDIAASAVIGSILLVLIRCITMEEAYKAIEWRIIFLLAGVLALEAAMENSHAGELVSEQIIATVGVWGPIAMVSAFYLMTFILTEMMSNTATAALLTPVAIATANTMNVSPRPFLVAVMFAASASFMTPVGYQTNTLIYGPGQYRFADFLRVGTPLNILFWITATILIPYFWSF